MIWQRGQAEEEPAPILRCAPPKPTPTRTACRRLGCADASCTLCANNPQRKCGVDFFQHKYFQVTLTRPTRDQRRCSAPKAGRGPFAFVVLRFACVPVHVG